MGRFDSFISNTISNLDKVGEFISEKKAELDKDIEEEKKEQEAKKKAENERKNEINKYSVYLMPLLDIVEKDLVIFKKYKDRNDTRNLCIHLLKENHVFITTLGRVLEKNISGTYAPINNENLVIPRKVFGFTESAENNRQIIKDGIDALNGLLTDTHIVKGKFEIKITQIDNIKDKKHEYKDYCLYHENESTTRRRDIIAANHYSKVKSVKEGIGAGVGEAIAVAAVKAGAFVLNAGINGVVAVATPNEGEHKYKLEITRNV